jgi:16S rRNA processing protein RimM
VIGRITGVYGIKGWVRIHSYTEPEENLLGYEKLSLGRGGDWKAVTIDSGKQHGKGLVAHIQGVDDRTVAEGLKGSEIAVPADHLPELAQDEFYWHQLEGLEVHRGEQLLGLVSHLMETGANDVLVVRGCDGSIDQRERLIPWVRVEVIRSVDLTANRIEVEWDPEF